MSQKASLYVKGGVEAVRRRYLRTEGGFSLFASRKKSRTSLADKAASNLL
jgi:hypothetical protein